MAALARAARDHLERAKMLGASLDMRMKRGARDAAKIDEAWVPDDLWRADFDKVTNAITRAGSALKEALEGHQKQLGGMSVEELEEQLKAELPRIVAKFTAEDWGRLDEIRMRQVLKQPPREKRSA